MSNNKQINTRIQHKHDIESNWIKALNFIPKAGEIIVYDPDDNYDYARIKIGDGLTLVNELKFSEIQPDFSQNDISAPDYIKNRTHYVISKAPETVTWDGNSEGRDYIDTNDGIRLVKISDFIPDVANMIDASLSMQLTATVEGVTDSMNKSFLIRASDISMITETSYQVDDAMYVFAKTIEDNGTVVPSTGIYFLDIVYLYELMLGIVIDSFSISINFADNTKKLDIKYIPYKQRLPEVTAEDNGMILTAQDGYWVSKQLTTNTTPTPSNPIPITSGGVYTALGNRSKLLFDTTPKSSSNNLMTSGNIYNALQTKQDKITGTAGQFVVIGSDGNITTKTIVYAEGVNF